jgi:ABC-2 type transport system permease protein
LAPSHHPRLRQLELGAPGRAWLALRDTVAGLYLFRLARPLAPGDSLTLALQVRYQERGFPNDNPNLDVVTNGTFVTNAYLPSLGYMEAGELSDNQVRHQYGLAPQPGLANAHNLAARQNNYLSQDADWVRFEATVSTSLDQTAVAPGTLQRTWVQQGRRYFAYRADRPILNFYAFLSARYLQFHDQWLDSAGHRTVPITIYYQPGHDYNLRRLAAGAKEALAYCSGNFSPYPHRELRIVEFPRYQRYAQSFATMVAFSEGLGFVAHVDDHNPQSLDYPFYVTAHEVAHQWWAHQVIGANVEGCTLLSESLAEYTALMVMRQHYGLAAMERLLRLDMGRYLEGRSLAKQPEVPLARVGSQEYLHYRKGSVMFYALQDYMGESQLNGALRRYVQAMAFRPPPYPSAPELLDYLRQAAPDSLHPLLTDFFDRITLYNNRVIGPATATRLPDGRYRVSFTVRCAKFYADSLGQQHPAALSREALPVAIFPAPGPDKHLPLPMLLVKRRLATGDNRLQFTVADKPAAVAIDPYHELADRDLDDNKLEITP